MDEKPILLDLETLYLGIPDESVNLTFQDLADVKTTTTNQHVSEVASNIPTREKFSPSPLPSLAKIPSLDFSKGLQASIQASIQHNQHHHDIGRGGSPWGHFGQGPEENRGHGHVHDPPQFSHTSGNAKNPRDSKSPRPMTGGDNRSTYSMSYDDVSMASGKGGGGRRRPGIPHSKICTICSTYVYVFRTRCLVCGRVYCCRCVKLGMGEMVEGRKCIECLGLKFSQRYIERAGKVGCCNWRYPITMKQVEMICAEKGPRRSRGSHTQSGVTTPRSHTQSGVTTPRSKSPITPRSPHAIGNSNEHSFVMSSSFSPFSPHHII
ncbi:uncharacterized protein LOC131617462 [Vicia villosa]|uniref:uncharacterized protein LOC131617462 n=1 Tax=Vicia villosa TaxID=3911 RepID=UPI00273BA08B|nr:uncharacterized protein LOC131617462 [Vicia villosa]